VVETGVSEDEHPWSVPSVPAAGACTAGYALFLLHAIFDGDGFLLLDYVNLMFHEAGHVIFAFLGLIGGTVAEMLVPAIVTGVFVRQRQWLGVVFGGFWIGEDLRYIARYVSDARAQQLPLVGSGDHDWNLLLGSWGLLERDTFIGGALAVLGWLLMIAAAAAPLVLALVTSRKTSDPA
jgi:hypothetical protein